MGPCSFIGDNMIYIRKAISKDLEYWKRKLIGILNKAPMSKSIEEIFVPDSMLKSLDDKAEHLLCEVMIKARGYAVGTIREWSGKKYKKLSSGKWMRTYTGTGERGEQQAIRNVMKKIQNASSMEDLSKIVSANMQRFKGEDGKTLPIVKEFMTAARGTESGKKVKKEKPLTYQQKDAVAKEKVQKEIVPKIGNAKRGRGGNKVTFDYEGETYTLTKHKVFANHTESGGKTYYGYGGELNKIPQREHDQLIEVFKDSAKNGELYGVPTKKDSSSISDKDPQESPEDKEEKKPETNAELDNRRMLKIMESLQTTPNKETFSYNHKTNDSLTTHFEKINNAGTVLEVTITANGHIVQNFRGTVEEVKKELHLKDSTKDDPSADKEVPKKIGIKNLESKELKLKQTKEKLEEAITLSNVFNKDIKIDNNISGSEKQKKYAKDILKNRIQLVHKKRVDALQNITNYLEEEDPDDYDTKYYKKGIERLEKLDPLLEEIKKEKGNAGDIIEDKDFMKRLNNL